jgi:alanyl aminopeptidase
VYAGTLPIADALDALAPIARDPEGEVAVEAIPLIVFARDRVLPDSERARVDAYAVKLFTPAFERLGFSAKKNESTSARRLRIEVIELLAKSNSAAVVKQAVKRGRAYAGLADGKFHPEAVDPDLAGLVLGIALEHGDKAFFDAMLARLNTLDDGSLRERVLSALGQARDPERSARALALSLDPKLRKQEGLIEVFEQSYDHRTRDASWRFVQENFDTLVQKIPDTRAAFIPYVTNAFCDLGHAEEAKAFFGPRAEKNNGMPKNLRQVVEYIRLCAAQADAQRASAEKFFAGPARAKKAS